MNNILNRAARLDRAVARHLGWALRLDPMKKSRVDIAPDTERVGGEFRGHLFFENELGEFDSKFQRGLSVAGTVLKVGFDELPDGAVIQQGDYIVALELNEKIYQCSNVTPQAGQYVVGLTEVS